MHELLRELADLMACNPAEAIVVGVASLPALVWIVGATRRGQRYPERWRDEK
jgi:hypothetical protein